LKIKDKIIDFQEERHAPLQLVPPFLFRPRFEQRSFVFGKLQRRAGTRADLTD
jgi:hypothetical protein